MSVVEEDVEDLLALCQRRRSHAVLALEPEGHGTLSENRQSPTKEYRSYHDIQREAERGWAW